MEARPLRRGVGAVALSLAAALAAAADAPYAAGPWDPATEAAAEAAVARLGVKRFVAIQGTVSNIVGLTSGVTASVSSWPRSRRSGDERRTCGSLPPE